MRGARHNTLRFAWSKERSTHRQAWSEARFLRDAWRSTVARARFLRRVWRSVVARARVLRHVWGSAVARARVLRHVWRSSVALVRESSATSGEALLLVRVVTHIIYICHGAVANLLSIFKKRLGEVAQLGAPLPRREPLRHGGWRKRLDARTSMPKLIPLAFSASLEISSSGGARARRHM